MTDDGGGVLRIMLSEEGKVVLRIETDLPDNYASEFHIDADDLHQVLLAINYMGNG